MDLSHLSDKELSDLGRLLDRVGVLAGDGAGVARRNRYSIPDGTALFSL